MAENLGKNLTTRERIKLTWQRVAKHQDEKTISLMQEAIKREKASKETKPLTTKPVNSQQENKYVINLPHVDYAKLAESLALSNEQGTNVHELTEKLANHFNQTLGGALDGATLIDSLIFPQSDFIEHTGPAERESLSKVGTLIRRQYNRSINLVRRTGVKTVSELRTKSYNDLIKIRTAGPLAVSFLIAAFKLQSPKS